MQAQIQVVLCDACVLKLHDKIYTHDLLRQPKLRLTSSMAIILQLCSLATPLPARSKMRPGVATTTCTLHPGKEELFGHTV